MRQYRIRTIMGLIAVVAVSLWAGMLIERARRPPRATYTADRPIAKAKSYTVMRPVRRTTNGEVRP